MKTNERWKTSLFYCPFQSQSAIIPIIGPRAFDHPTRDNDEAINITTACELFVNEAKRLACFQLRSPLVPDQMQSFFDDVLQFLQTQRIGNLMILTSSFAHEQHTIESTKFMYLANDTFKKAFAQHFDSTEWNEHTATIIHGGGFAMKLWQRLTGVEFAVCLLFKYVSEGDNRADAAQFVEQLDALQGNRLLGSEIRLKMPISWRALYGNDPTEQLYWKRVLLSICA